MIVKNSARNALREVFIGKAFCIEGYCIQKKKKASMTISGGEHESCMSMLLREELRVGRRRRRKRTRVLWMLRQRRVSAVGGGREDVLREVVRSCY